MEQACACPDPLTVTSVTSVIKSKVLVLPLPLRIRLLFKATPKRFIVPAPDFLEVKENTSKSRLILPEPLRPTERLSDVICFPSFSISLNHYKINKVRQEHHLIL